MKDKVRPHLLASSWFRSVYDDFKRVPNRLKGKTEYPLSTCLMSAWAMFSLKYRSLLQFHASQTDKKIRHHLKTRFSISKAPSDTEPVVNLFLPQPIDCVPFFLNSLTHVDSQESWDYRPK